MNNEELCILAQQGNLEARNALILNNQNYLYKEANALKPNPATYPSLYPQLPSDLYQSFLFNFAASAFCLM